MFVCVVAVMENKWYSVIWHAPPLLPKIFHFMWCRFAIEHIYLCLCECECVERCMLLYNIIHALLNYSKPFQFIFRSTKWKLNDRSLCTGADPIVEQCHHTPHSLCFFAGSLSRIPSSRGRFRHAVHELMTAIFTPNQTRTIQITSENMKKLKIKRIPNQKKPTKAAALL